MMSIPKRLAVVFAVAGGLCFCASAGAEINWNYFDIDFVNVDVDFSETIVDDELEAGVSTDNDYGYRFGVAWQFYENLHVFGDYSSVENDVTITPIGDMEFEPIDGKFDVTRWRVGIGYGLPVNPDLNVYGRMSYDFIDASAKLLEETLRGR